MPRPRLQPVRSLGADAALIEDIVTGSRVLADFGVLDGFGHVSARHPANPNRFLMSRSLAPALVTADDIMEFDLDGNAVDARGRSLFLERFIHSEIYRARPDVMSVVHTHSPGVIPYTISQVPLRAVFHNAAFLAAGAPVWDIRKDFGETDMLVRDAAIGKALALTLGDKSVVLMRGHGDVTVGPSVKLAVFRAYYTDVNARLQSQAIALGGEPSYLTPGEGAKADAVNLAIIDRIWNLWKMRVSTIACKVAQPKFAQVDMPLQNRVTPTGDIIATPHRGLFTGNRGIIHDPATKTLLKKRWSSPAWITCVCEFRGWRRKVMGGRSWTELFFLDEATAFAAGHRPCFFCRRDDANRFRAAWEKGNGVDGHSRARDGRRAASVSGWSAARSGCIRCRCRWRNCLMARWCSRARRVF